MGEFSAGRWVLGFAIYFFMVFLIVLSAMNTAADYNLDASGLSASDKGFMSNTNIPYAQGGVCSGRPYYLCSSTGIDNDTICDMYTGCYWGANLFKDDSCKGVFNGYCDDLTDAGNCSLWACTWTDYTNSGGVGTVEGITNTYDWSTVKNTIGFMTGFNTSFGIPASINFIFAFFFIWVPFFAMMWSLYAALPFLH